MRQEYIQLKNPKDPVDIRGVIGDSCFASIWEIDFYHTIYQGGDLIYTMEPSIEGKLTFSQFDLNKLLSIQKNSSSSCKDSPFDIVLVKEDDQNELLLSRLTGVILESIESFEDVTKGSYEFSAQGFSPWGPIPLEDSHKGMIQNPMTGDWKWL